MAKANPVGIQKHLKGVDYPATKQQLIEHAKQQKADEDVLSILEQLPDDQEFSNPTDLNKAIGDIM
jgi:5,10-methylene-tetrahydrofolate dehydrogenase/methenyl tetrahydrofolate cyclohydrolase